MHRLAAAAFTVVNLNLAIGLISAAQVSQNNPTFQQVSATTGSTSGVSNQQVQPFTHSAYIPVNSDPASIRFERVKAVEIHTSAASAKDSSYCDQLAFREPGGSMFCSGGKDGPLVKAYEVMYSYLGQPLASDEHGDGRFTFKVYFRPDEVAAPLREGMAFKKPNRTETAAFFTVKTEREAERHVQVDEARSQICPGHYSDGAWVKNDGTCKDELVYKTGVVPSGFVTVTVSPVATQVAGNLPNN